MNIDMWLNHGQTSFIDWKFLEEHQKEAIWPVGAMLNVKRGSPSKRRY